MRISFEYRSSHKTENFIRKMQSDWARAILERYGKRGVELLKNATPKDTGVTADSWYYRITKREDGYTISWHNSNKSGEGKGSIPIVVLIVYGHTTRNGGYVAPNDFISPVTKELFDQLANDLWLEVTKA